MARRSIRNNEIKKYLLFWHGGMSLRKVARTLDCSTITVTKYIRLAESFGLKRNEPIEDINTIISKIKKEMTKKPTKPHPKPSQDLLEQHHDELVAMIYALKYRNVSKVLSLFSEAHPEISICYNTLLKYINRNITVPKSWRKKS